MRSRTAALLFLGLVLAGCSGQPTASEPTPDVVRDIDIELLLPDVEEIDDVMGTAMSPEPAEDRMADNRNLVSNVNCLGMWHVSEAGVYGEQGGDGWSAVRAQNLRAPDADTWTSLVSQAVVTYPSAEAAQAFFAQSADRWAQCTDHTINLNLNGTQLPRWRSGALDLRANRLAVGIARGVGDQTKSCQRILAVRSNVIADVEACRAGVSAIDQAARIASLIESRIK